MPRCDIQPVDGFAAALGQVQPRECIWTLSQQSWVMEAGEKCGLVITVQQPTYTQIFIQFRPVYTFSISQKLIVLQLISRGF